jgi:hypothetical protein
MGPVTLPSFICVMDPNPVDPEHLCRVAFGSGVKTLIDFFEIKIRKIKEIKL